MSIDSGFGTLLPLLVLSGGAGFALAWRLLGRALGRSRMQCGRLQAALADKEHSLERALARCDESQRELSGLHEKLGEDETRIEQLRDLVKVHVARRREFDEWANPIRASLGESVGQTVRALKERLTQQELAIRSQERRVAEAEAQYRGKHGELEGMRRELTLKNYHIAALNERFIRVEERMHELTTQVSAIGTARSGAGAAAGRSPTPWTGPVAPVSPETERFAPDSAESRDWMQVLDDWHRQLHDRLDRMDSLQSQLRAGAERPGSHRPAAPGRGGADAA